MDDLYLSDVFGILTTYPDLTSTSSPQVYVTPLSGASLKVTPVAGYDCLPLTGSLSTQVTIARSPSCTLFTSDPVAITVPVPSCPNRAGVGASGLCIWCN